MGPPPLEPLCLRCWHHCDLPANKTVTHHGTDFDAPVSSPAPTADRATPPLPSATPPPVLTADLVSLTPSPTAAAAAPLARGGPPQPPRGQEHSRRWASPIPVSVGEPRELRRVGSWRVGPIRFHKISRRSLSCTEGELLQRSPCRLVN